MKTFLRLVGIICASAISACAVEQSEEPSMEDGALSAGEIGPQPEGVKTRYPILVTLGAGNTPNHWPMYGVLDALKADGHVVSESTVPVHGVAVRVSFVAKAVDDLLDKCRGEKSCDPSRVNIIAYSQGGLDARALAHHPDYIGKVASISLIGTPNRGSSIADAILSGSKPVRAAVEWLIEKWTATYSEPGFPEQNAFAAWEALSEKHVAEFNRRYPDRPEIFYQSWAGVSEPAGKQSDEERRAAEAICEGKMIRAPGGRTDWLDPRMVAGHELLEGLSHETNDGLVTVRSAKWAHFRGCLPADHQDFLGRVADNDRDRRTGFNHVRFYRNLAFELATRGF